LHVDARVQPVRDFDALRIVVSERRRQIGEADRSTS
jgi:hypothetical protein